MLVIDVLDHIAARRLFPELRAAHVECFPNDVPNEGSVPNDGETEDAFFDRVTWLHEEQEVTWFVLRELDARGRRGAIVGFACGCPYADSWYGAHLGVVPRRRGKGLGSYLMRVSQVHAGRLGITRLQASVEVDRKIGKGRLLKYYERHGARTVETGFGSAGSVAASVIRIERVFTLGMALRELEDSERRVHGSAHLRSQIARRFIAIVALCVVLQKVRSRK
jgi:GNAT superfamily N-acetyltransferase